MNLVPAKHPLAFRFVVPTLHLLPINLSNGNLLDGKMGHRHPLHLSHAEGSKGNILNGKMGHPHPLHLSPHRNVLSNSIPIFLS